MMVMTVRTAAQIAQAGETARRASMRAYKSALFKSLAMFPAPNHPHLLAAIMEAVEGIRAANPFDPFVMTMDTVAIYERDHPDMAAFADMVGLTEETIDAIFTVAMAIDRRESEADVLALFAALTE